MALTVEDGTGLATAESYATVTEADTYHSNLGNASWAPLSTAVKEQALRQAANWMMQKFRARWKGWRNYTVQRLDWPRIGVYLDDTAAFPQHGRLSSFAYMIPVTTVPSQVKEAQCELALIAATNGPLTPQSLSQNRLQVKTGPVYVEFDPRSPQTPRYPVVVQILAPLLQSAGGGVMKVYR